MSKNHRVCRKITKSYRPAVGYHAVPYTFDFASGCRIRGFGLTILRYRHGQPEIRITPPTEIEWGTGPEAQELRRAYESQSQEVRP